MDKMCPSLTKGSKKQKVLLLFYSDILLERKMIMIVIECIVSTIKFTGTAARFNLLFSDLINLLVKNENFIIQAVQQHQPAVIPCRPTSLGVNVTLWKDAVQVCICTSQ
jgi:hypothetical protein